MPEEKIILPDFLIADLYKGSLVEVEAFEEKVSSIAVETSAATKETTTSTSQETTFLGGNKKNVIILVNKPNVVYLEEEELTFLTNILKACHLGLADIAIINTATQQLEYQAIKGQLKAETILLFDVDPSTIKLPFLIPAFQLQRFDGCTIMVAPPLSILNKPGQEGRLLKTKLWLSLKQVFNIP